MSRALRCDLTKFCNDLCIGKNVAMIRGTFFALVEPTDFAVYIFFLSQILRLSYLSITTTTK